jgi:phage terminase small subunit
LRVVSFSDHTACTVAADAAEDMLRFAGEFGLTPVARTRLASGGYAPPPGRGKFDGLLG